MNLTKTLNDFKEKADQIGLENGLEAWEELSKQVET